MNDLGNAKSHSREKSPPAGQYNSFFWTCTIRTLEHLEHYYFSTPAQKYFFLLDQTQYENGVQTYKGIIRKSKKVSDTFMPRKWE